MRARPLISDVNNTVAANEVVGYHIMCKGCKHKHFIYTNLKFSPIAWDFNGDIEKPTFSPSLLVDKGGNYQCHSFIKNGQIEYLNDCHHELKGKTIDLPEI